MLPKQFAHWTHLRDAALPRPLVLCNGVFDLLHAGHVHYLQAAKALGATLVVAVNTDDSVQRLNKGPDRPWQCLNDRMTLLAALQVVDAVLAFEEDTACTVVEQLRPDIYVKGADYAHKPLPEADIVRRYGGRVELIPLTPDRSTSQLIRNIQASSPSRP